MDGQEAEARKNARVCNKIRIAMPRELSPTQNADLMRDFVRRLTSGCVPWFYAIHDRGKDRHNPHAHLVIIDRDIENGKRVLRLSDSPKDREKAGLAPNGVEWIRAIWEQCVNLALERAGLEARIDRRSLAAQGIDREPTIHVGPRANKIDAAVWRPQSKLVPSPTPRQPDRVIDYIDAGRTRRERNAEIIDLNLDKAARSPDFETRLWAHFEREQRVMDRLVDARCVTAARRRTLEERRLRNRFKDQLRDARNRRHAEGTLTRAWTNQRLAPEIASLKTCQDAERATMQRQQGRLTARFMAAIDITGRTRRKRNAAVQALGKRHERERASLAAHIPSYPHRADRFRPARYQPEIDAIKLNRRQQVAGLKARHHDDMLHEDAALQVREAEREQGRQILKQQIDAWKKSQQETSGRHAAEAPKRPANDGGPSPAPDRPRLTQPPRPYDKSVGPSP
jgi:hypothetical protein